MENRYIFSVILSNLYGGFDRILVVSREREREREEEEERGGERTMTVHCTRVKCNA